MLDRFLHYCGQSLKACSPWILSLSVLPESGVHLPFSVVILFCFSLLLWNFVAEPLVGASSIWENGPELEFCLLLPKRQGSGHTGLSRKS